MLIFRNTGLDDERHIAFSENFGELDDMMPHVIAGRKLRIPDPRMFDVSNLDLEGNVVNETSPERMAAALVRFLYLLELAAEVIAHCLY